jgi:hypothetical protein
MAGQVNRIFFAQNPDFSLGKTTFQWFPKGRKCGDVSHLERFYQQDVPHFDRTRIAFWSGPPYKYKSNQLQQKGEAPFGQTILE